MITGQERDRLEKLVRKAIYRACEHGRAVGTSDFMDVRGRAVDATDALLAYINSLPTTDADWATVAIRAADLVDAESVAARVEAQVPNIRRRLEGQVEVVRALLEELSDAITVLDSTPKGGDAS